MTVDLNNHCDTLMISRPRVLSSCFKMLAIHSYPLQSPHQRCIIRVRHAFQKSADDIDLCSISQYPSESEPLYINLSTSESPELILPSPAMRNDIRLPVNSNLPSGWLLASSDTRLGHILATSFLKPSFPFELPRRKHQSSDSHMLRKKTPRKPNLQALGSSEVERVSPRRRALLSRHRSGDKPGEGEIR
jgi:hypothetical protein